jgi:hypothetical protein
LGEITSLKVRKATRDRLAKLGNKTETFDDIISRLIAFYERDSKIRKREAVK